MPSAMLTRLLLLSVPALFVLSTITSCTSDDTGDDAASETGTSTASETETQASETSAGTETGETGEAACGVDSDSCCAAMAACEVTEDCCEPETYTCYLVGSINQCADLVMLCSQCMMGCRGVPPDVCENACAAFCNPSP